MDVHTPSRIHYLPFTPPITGFGEVLSNPMTQFTLCYLRVAAGKRKPLHSATPWRLLKWDAYYGIFLRFG